MENYNELWDMFFKEFVKEVIKKVAKGSATPLQKRVKNLLQPEFTKLGLDASHSLKEIQKRLEAKPEIKEQIQQKMESNTELFEELVKVLNKKADRIINTKNYIENARDVTIN